MSLIVSGGIGGLLQRNNPAFEPLPSMMAFWVADQGVTLNVANVSQWNDLTGNNRHFTQATASKQPAYGTSNGVPALIFDGSNDIMFTPSFTVTQTFTVIMVMRLISYTANAYVLCGRAENFGVIYQNPGSGFVRPYSGYTENNGPWAEPTINPAANKLITVKFAGASSEIYLNGTLAGSGNAGTSGNTGFAIGGYYAELAGFYSLVCISALTVLDATATAGDISAVETLLTSSYGVA